MDEVKIWAIEDADEVVALDAKGQMDTEWSFEDTLVKNPNLLMQGLTLVGRQTPTEGGPLDLLGVYRVYFAIAPDVERRGIEVCFYPRAIDLSFDEFDQLDPEAVSFRRGSPWGQSTERVKEEILFPLNTHAEWEKHKEELTRLTSSVYEAWQKRDQQGEPLEA